MIAEEWRDRAYTNIGSYEESDRWLSEQCERLEKDCARKDQEIAALDQEIEALKSDLAECIASYSLHNP